MQRISCPERSDWRATAENSGFYFHTINGERYWDERAYYAFTLDEIERRIEEPTGEIDAMCLELVGRAIDNEDYLRRLKIPEAFWPLIAESWHRDEASLYGRLDLRFDGQGPAKLLEYNADTPTSIFEAAVFQWTWLEQAIERHIIPDHADQFNSIHERLIEAWKNLAMAATSISPARPKASRTPAPSPIWRTQRGRPACKPHCSISPISDGARAAASSTWRAAKSSLCSNSIPGSGCSRMHLARGLRTHRRAGSSRPGRPSSPTRASFPCCGRCFRITRICCPPSSRTTRTWPNSMPPSCASRSIPAKAPMLR